MAAEVGGTATGWVATGADVPTGGAVTSLLACAAEVASIAGVAADTSVAEAVRDSGVSDGSGRAASSMPGWRGTSAAASMESWVRGVSAGCNRVNCLSRAVSTSRTVRTSASGRLSSAINSAVTAKVLTLVGCPG